MAYLVNSVCIADAVEAVNSFYSIQQPFTISPYHYIYQFDGSVWVLNATEYVSGAPASSTNITITQNPPLPDCSGLYDKATSFAEGQELGWLIAGLIVIGACFRFLRTRR